MISKELLREILGVEATSIFEVSNNLVPIITNTGFIAENIYELMAKAKEYFRAKGINILTEYNEMWYAISVEAGSVLSVSDKLAQIEIIHESMEVGELEAFFKECEWILNER